MRNTLLCLLLVPVAGLAQTVTFTEANINSIQSTFFDPTPDLIRSDTAADVERGPVTGTTVARFNGSPTTNFVNKSVTDTVYAKASLQTGTLKTKAVLTFGLNTLVGGSGVPLGFRNGSASGTATFADSFRTFSGPKPFLWTSGTTATFHFAVTGQSTVTGTVADPSLASPPKPLNQITSLLAVRVYKPGTIDLLRQQRDFDFATRPFSEWLALDNQIQANQIIRDYWYFGQLTSDFTSSVPAAKKLSVSPGTPTNVDFTFTPNGDFDWVAVFDTGILLDATLTSVSVSEDFSNSTVSTYTGPPGTTTYSGSGIFPSTLPSTQTPQATQCPAAQGLWKNHTDAWRVSSMLLGSQTYTSAELLNILKNPGGGDASNILAVQLIAAKLNLANYSNPAPISATIASADTLLQGFAGKLPYNVKPNTVAGKAMTQLAATLESYNQQLLTPVCTQ